MAQRSSHKDADDFSWMRDVSNPRFLLFLQEENARFAAAIAPARDIEQELFEEIASRSPRVIESVPYKYGEYEYRLLYPEGAEYPRFERAQSRMPESRETILDYADVAGSYASCDILVSVDRRSSLLAFAIDVTGERLYTIRFKDLATGAVLPQTISGASGNMVFSKDGRNLFYTELDSQTLRWRRVKRYRIGADPQSSETVYDEADEAFSCSVYLAKGDDFVFIRSSSGEEDEVRFITSDDVLGPARLIAPRRPKCEYEVQFDGVDFVIRTNYNAPNFRLMRAAIDVTEIEAWRPFWAPEPGCYLEEFEVLQGTIAVIERVDGAMCGRIIPSGIAIETPFASDRKPASIAFKANVELDAGAIRYEWSTYIDFPRICQIDLDSRETRVLKFERAAGNFDQNDYEVEEHRVDRPDGARVPLTILSRKGDRGQPGPTLVYGYGAYGFSIDPYLWLPRFSLIDRGFRIAIAHVRGGGELGRAWHEAGRRRAKTTSIADFIACAEYTREVRLASNIYAMGESAGGVLVGAALNARPDLFCAAVTIAPFVDLLNSLSDPTIPLTTTDYDEWGDPNDPSDRRCILSYAPYEKLQPQPYPHVLALARLHDTQVAVWEPAKWIARMRTMSTGSGVQFLKTEFDTGHLGRSGRYEQFRDTATAYAFLIGVERGLIG
ncbi:S9 family peptidase (plasmid) [Bradyrhizobium sp. 155]|uniref:prolyl oligopeptidase family serine peptidase n=1 Tax=Bradyrhizobium sp. 155 TaxID=2782629 RepID=UPI002063704F|nr:prolyl oligopeptidase family serine peptidase [Bradyrhizobium sp. 155]UPK15942.1 S9 family peptidase [Bradyrhizobium sp. 155]